MPPTSCAACQVSDTSERPDLGLRHACKLSADLPAEANRMESLRCQEEGMRVAEA